MRKKIIIIIISCFLLVILTLLRTSFYAPVTYSEWKDLTWEDFKGVPVIFTGWGAAISSNIYTKYDSAEKTYVAYSLMNHQKSWKKLSYAGSEYTLNHEQYHFNLTESYARLLNAKIKLDSLGEEKVKSELTSLRKQLNYMQDLYDEEADHGSNKDMQRYWEFKIDSMMIVHSGNSGVITDYLSEASLFFPKKAEVYATYSGGYSYRLFGNTDIYDMSIAVLSRNSYQSPNSIKRDFENYYMEDSLTIINSVEDTTDQVKFEILYELVNKDSTKYYTDRLIKKFGFLHTIRILHPVEAKVEGYKRIKNSILNSFKTIDSKEYWINKLDSSDGFYVENITNEGATKEEYENMDCWVYNSEAGVDYGVYSRLIEMDDGYIIPYDPAKVQDSLIYDVMLIANNEIQVFKDPESFEEFFYIPKVDGNLLDLRFGYTLKEDTSQVCFQFYNNNIGFTLN